MKVYLAGPMSHYRSMNFPRFDEVAADLRARGFEVVSPAELDSPESRAAALAAEDGDLSEYSERTGETWGDLLARDCKLIADDGIEAVVVLEGWQASRGARLEAFVARLCGIPVVEYHRYSPMLAVREGEWGTVHGAVSESSGLNYITDPAREELSDLPDLAPYIGIRTRERFSLGGDKTSFIQGAMDSVARDVAAELPRAYVESRDLSANTATFDLRINERGEFILPPAGPFLSGSPIRIDQGAGEHVVTEERVVNEATGGQKGRKAERYDLLPWVQLAEVARLYGKGAAKYEPRNWERGYDWSLSFGALHRHLAAFWAGEDTDAETQCHHLASVIFHALALMYFGAQHPNLDDRPVISSLT